MPDAATFFALLAEDASAIPVAAATQWLAEASAADVAQFLAVLEQQEPSESAAPLLRSAFGQLVQRLRAGLPAGCEPEQIAELDRLLGDRCQCRGPLLQWLAEEASPASHELLTETLLTRPPSQAEDVMLAFSPLFQQNDVEARELFPRLLDGLSGLAVAAPILDLANYLHRRDPGGEHPAAERIDQLLSLLSQLCQRLAFIEEDPRRGGDADQVGHVVLQSVPLAVSLCDSLALIGDPRACSPLTRALDLRHRRIRCEAAWALAALGDAAGGPALVELAAEPVARIRAVQYAEELDLRDEIDPQYLTPAALAESQLCVWLAEPAQFGLAPQSMELVDERTQYWPGHEDPVDCFLFRYEYRMGAGTLSNIGVAGPLTHSFGCDLSDLPVEDIYAAHAGWEAEHEELEQYEIAALTAAGRLEVERLQRRLHDAGYEQLEPRWLGIFFGDKVLVASAEFESQAGTAIADGEGVVWLPASDETPLGPHEAYCIYKGRRLLHAFND